MLSELNKSDIGLLTFQCNICSTINRVPVNSLNRETPSCSKCASTVRMRGMIHALSVALYQKSLPINEFPLSREIKGIGMSDWDTYAKALANRVSYVNTYYHKEPKLDITDIKDRDESTLDFILTTDVFEHVLAPCSRAFENSYKLLKPGGHLVMSVPYSLENEDNQEHFSDLHDFKIVEKNNRRVLINETSTGNIQEYDNLIFHGGEGDTLEMRLFSEAGLIKNLKDAGFDEIQFMKDPCFEYGVYWPHTWSLPVIARK